MKTVANHCDRAIVLSKGEIILDGPPENVYSQTEKLLEADIYPPQVTRLGQSLKDYGFPDNVLTVKEMVEILKFNLMD